jgi:predicted CopG family antitoxin
MFKHTWNGGNLVKTITIRSDVYEKLTAVKGEDESFSELFERLVEGVDPIKTLKRLRGIIGPEDRKAILAELRKRRAEWR